MSQAPHPAAAEPASSSPPPAPTGAGERSPVPGPPAAVVVGAVAEDEASFRASIERYRRTLLGGSMQSTVGGWPTFVSLARTVRDSLSADWLRTQQAYDERDVRRVCLVSLEVLRPGSLDRAMLYRGIAAACSGALADLGLPWDDVRNVEADAGFDDDGCDRPVAAVLDSLATLQLPACGYGIRFAHHDLRLPNDGDAPVGGSLPCVVDDSPWEVARPDEAVTVRFAGHVHLEPLADGNLAVHWTNTEDVVAVPCDMPVPGYRNGTVHTVRLWWPTLPRTTTASPPAAGEERLAIDARVHTALLATERVSDDDTPAGRELRLRQAYFVVAATLQDIVRQVMQQWQMHDEKAGIPLFAKFADRVVVQIDGLGTAIAIPEMLRILLDEHGLSWEAAWALTTGVFGASPSSTSASTAAFLPVFPVGPGERWPVWMLAKVLPRQLQLIFEINARFLHAVRARHPGDDDRCRRLSLVEEGDEQKIRMGHLAFVGSHGVDHLADDADALLANDGFPFVPDDGARQSELTRHALIGRRWLLQANPGLSGLITEAIGDRWTTDLSQLRELVTFVDDVGFHDRWCTVKKANKERLADELVRRYRRRGERLTIPTDALFDCHVAAVSMEQRQLLNLLHVLTLYQRIKDQPRASHTPRVVLFAGSAAPGDLQAQQLLRLIHAVGQVVNHDEQVGERLKVVVLAEPRGALAGRIVAAADVFEQIALAGTGAAGRGRMEFPLNGARTVGTMDGANRALADALGRDHLFLFGLSADEARELRRDYSPALFVAQSEELKGVLDRVGSGAFSPHEPALFRPIVDDLLTRDASLTLADYDACVTAQEVAAAAFGELALWTRTAIWTVAHAGGFSADRTVATSARDRWRLQPVRSR